MVAGAVVDPAPSGSVSITPDGKVATTTPPRVLRVAYLHNALPLGGVETHILNLCTHLDRARIVPHLCLYDDVAGYPEGSSPHELGPAARDAGCAVKHYAVRRKQGNAVAWEASAYAALVADLKRGGFDVAFTWFGGLHPAEPSGVPLGVAAAAAAGIPRQVQRVEWQNPPLPGLPVVS